MRLIIAEDLVLLRDGLAQLLTNAGHAVVAQVGDARALIAATVEHRPDLVIVDVRMPPGFHDEGARAVLLLRERYPNLPVIILSHVVEQRIATAIRQGGDLVAFGYVLKDRVLDTEEFLDTIDLVASGGTAIDLNAINSYLASNVDRLSPLTSRELEVLRLLASGRSNVGIANSLIMSPRTVEAHLRSIFAKLDITPDPDDNQRVRAAIDWLASGADPVH